MSILGNLLHGRLEPPSARGHALGAGFDAWFLKACHRDPEQRFASAGEQIEALAEALGLPVDAGEAMAGMFTRAASPHARSRVGPLLLAGGALAVVSIAVALAVLRPGARKPDAPPVAATPEAATPSAPELPREIPRAHVGAEAIGETGAARPPKREPDGARAAAPARRPGAGVSKSRPADPFADQK